MFQLLLVLRCDGDGDCKSSLVIKADRARGAKGRSRDRMMHRARNKGWHVMLMKGEKLHICPTCWDCYNTDKASYRKAIRDRQAALCQK